MQPMLEPAAQLRYLARVALDAGHFDEAARQFSQALAVSLQTDPRSALDTLHDIVEAARTMNAAGAYAALGLLAHGMTQAITVASQAAPFEDAMGHAAGLVRQVATIAGALSAIQSGSLPIDQTEAWGEQVRRQARDFDAATDGWLDLSGWVARVLG